MHFFGLKRSVFRDALLHTTVVMCGYLRYCHLPVSFDQSGSSPSPLTSLINNTFLPAEPLLTGCFTHHSLQTLETVVLENPRRSAVSEILKPPCLAPTIIPRSKSLRSHFFPILTFGLKNSWTSSTMSGMLWCIELLPRDWLGKYLH